MPSTYSPELRLNEQNPGENLNTWGNLLNTGALQLLEDSIAKRVAFALSGSHTLTAVNGASDEARCAYLDVTSGSGGTIIAPAVSKIYLVHNGASGDVAINCGGGSATVKAGEIGFVACDGANFARIQLTDFSGQQAHDLADPTSNQDAATKHYVDSQNLTAMSGTFPGQPGNAGKLISTNGSAPLWGIAQSTQDGVSNSFRLLANDQATLLGGPYGNTSGDVGLVNAAGSPRLKTKSDGSVWAASDAAPGVFSQLATQAFAVAAASAL